MKPKVIWIQWPLVRKFHKHETTNANNYVYNDHDRGSHTVELTFKDISTYYSK